MGCGAVRRAQIVIYINEATPPYAGLVAPVEDAPSVYPPSGIVKRGDDIYFDDKELIKQCQAVHVDKVIVYCQELILGIELVYCLDQAIQTRVHAMEKGGVQMRLDLDEDESIVYVETTASAAGVHSLVLKTSKGHQLVAEGKKGRGEQTAVQTFAEEKRAVVAVKGCYGTVLKALGVYTWKMRRS